jgi:predicted nucleotidyltransferase
MSNSFGLPERTINELLEYFKIKPEIQKVIIYGSRAKGTYKNGSDIDFAIWSDKDNTSEIATELDELQTPYMFDVTDYKTLSHENLKKNIDKEGVVFYKRD